MRFVRGYGVLRDRECCFFSANLADVQLAATLTPDGPVQLIIDFVSSKINPFLSHLLSLSVGLFTGHLRKNLLPGGPDLSWRAFSTAIAGHLRFERPSEAEAWSYKCFSGSPTCS
jgi:hypothetical protein